MKIITKIVIVGAIAGLAFYDLIALTFGGIPATISRVLLNYSIQTPSIPFALGFLMGHLFWPQKETESKEKGKENGTIIS